MKLELVKEDYLKEIGVIDTLAFHREEPRKLINLRTLNQSAPEGSFVAMENGKVVGFVFSKVFGREGFIGPIGIHPDFQGRGYGKKLLEASIEYLKLTVQLLGWR
jgi:ribosomal protein S18 acetylase RimI-like enzyme